MGAVAVAGVLTGSVVTFTKGPMQGSVKMSQISRAETQMNIAGQAAIMAATNLATAAADCDSDGMIEPLEWRDGTVKPTGGGLIPMGLGIAKKDPWGTEYGYCVWDHGTSILNPTCRMGAGDRRLQGTASANYPVIAIVSAGPDKTFTTTCRNFSLGADRADQTNNGVLTDSGDRPLISKAADTDDDLIFVRNYEQAAGMSGDLWALAAGDSSKATIGKDIEVDGNASFSGSASFKRLASSSPTTDYLETSNGLKIAGPDVMTTCNAANKGVLRMNAAGDNIEICNGSSWGAITGSAGSTASDCTGLGTTSYNDAATGHCYYYNNTPVDWETAKTSCEANGAYLASITSDAERMFFVNNFVSGEGGFAGAKDDLVEGQWRWKTGELTGTQFWQGAGSASGGTAIPGVYSAWQGTSEPSGTTSDNCLRIDNSSNKRWQATGCNSLRGYFCEKSAGPSGGGGGGSGTAPPQHFVQLSGGSSGGAVCGIKTDNSLWCWGENGYGQLGDNSNTNKNVPTKIGSDSWSFIEVGRESTCGIKMDGTAWCWGLNEDGRLGNNSLVNSSIPVPVHGGGTWKDISAGYRWTCGIKSDGTGHCWGESGPALGHGSYTSGNRLAPGPINSPGTWTQISMGATHACGIKSDGSAWCWGSLGGTNSLGDGTSNDSYSPVPINQTGPWAEISTGDSHTCAIKVDQTLWCWGSNTYGALGIGSTTSQNTPRNVTGSWAKIASGNGNTCGIKTDGSAWCWGSNSSGNVADGTTTNRTSPVHVQPGSKWFEIMMGNGNVCGIKDTYATSCWGYAGYGSLGNGTNGPNATAPAPIVEIVVAGSGVFPLKAPDSTAAAPSYSFLNSPTTGMFFETGRVKLNSAGAIDIAATTQANFTGASTDFRIASGGGVKIGNDTGACNATLEGTIRYTSADIYEFCNGTTWTELKRGAPEDPNAFNHANVFVTSTTYNGNLGGLIGADEKCQQAAINAGLPGIYAAWLSDSTGSPSTRFKKLNKPYKLVNGTVIANDWADLTDGTLAAPIDVSETGSTISFRAMTSTNINGSLIGTNHCNNWTNATTSYTATVGSNTSTTSTWTNNTSETLANRRCNSVKSLYCVQQEGEEIGGGYVPNCEDYSSKIGLDSIIAEPPFTASAYIPGSRFSFYDGGASGSGANFAGGRKLITVCAVGQGDPTIGYYNEDTKMNQFPFPEIFWVPFPVVTVPSSGSATGEITFGTEVSIPYTLTQIPFGQIIFQTSQTFNGNLGGIAGADAKCQAAAATTSFLSGYTFKAVISDSSIDARDRITAAYPIVDPTNRVWLSSGLFTTTSLWTNFPDEKGVVAYRQSWTGTNTNGTKTAANCNNWSSAATNTYGSPGAGAHSYWLWASSSAPCNAARSLVCMSQ